MENRIGEDDYKKILEYMPIVCVDIVIVHKDKALLVLRNNNPAKGQWWLVGGRILKGERLEEAVKRKAFEETGLSVSVRKKIGFYETIFQDGPFSSIKGGVHTINVCFLAKCLDKHPKVRMDKTSKDYKWIDALDCSLPTYPQQVLKDAGVFADEK